MHELLVCPECHAKLQRLSNQFQCSICKKKYPIIKGIPVLLSSKSVFSVEEVIKSDNTYYSKAVKEIEVAHAKRSFRRRLPKLTKSWERDKFYEVINSVLQGKKNPIGFQLGSGENPKSIENKIAGVHWIHSDVDLAFAPNVIADAIDIPLPNNSVDILIADNVLEHVFDLPKAVMEIQRVVKVGGIIAIGMPFLYPFMGAPYYFTRLTPCGVRSAFLQTENIFLARDSGAFVALALQLEARLINLFVNRSARGVAMVASRLLFSGLKHLDRIYKSSRHLSTAAALLYVGIKTNEEFSPQEVVLELRNWFAEAK